ncbi:MAG TPA: tyrosine-type recombinase/integrase, partial [Acidimicrobiales bacterium]|nr:tyrosine-type recombinase/integrase [Acidimicrobiales bacterium]
MDVAAANASLLESWELDLRSPVRPGARPKRPRTITLYLDEVNRFAGWLADHGRPSSVPGDLAGVEHADVVAWVADLRSAGLSTSTIRSRWVALRSLYGWAHEEEITLTNPVARVHVPKADEPPPAVLSDDDLRLLLKACEGTTFNDRRDLALVRLMVASGLRVSEACALEVADVDLKARLVAVTDGKGGKSRVVRIDPTTAAAVDRYKRARGRPRLAARPELWLGHRGPVTRKGVPAILDKRADLAGIGHVHPHQLRHTWAHRSKKSGASSEDLQQLGGWSDPKVMRRYGAALAEERALAAYDEFGPMAGL